MQPPAHALKRPRLRPQAAGIDRAPSPRGPGNPRLTEARATVNASRTAGADTFAATVAPIIAEAQAAGAKSLRQIAGRLGEPQPKNLLGLIDSAQLKLAE